MFPWFVGRQCWTWLCDFFYSSSKQMSPQATQLKMEHWTGCDLLQKNVLLLLLLLLLTVMCVDDLMSIHLSLDFCESWSKLTVLQNIHKKWWNVCKMFASEGAYRYFWLLYPTRLSLWEINKTSQYKNVFKWCFHLLNVRGKKPFPERNSPLSLQINQFTKHNW